jgi:hypothetical protein
VRVRDRELLVRGGSLRVGVVAHAEILLAPPARIAYPSRTTLDKRWCPNN